jgi:hypothetical protein
VAAWIETNRESFDFVYWNILHEIWYFSIASLPNSAKDKLTVFLNNCTVPAEFVEEFARIVDFMNQGTSSDGQAMLTAIQQLDARRNQNLKAVALELAEIIGYE